MSIENKQMKREFCEGEKCCAHFRIPDVKDVPPIKGAELTPKELSKKEKEHNPLDDAIKEMEEYEEGTPKRDSSDHDE